jgi:hypothetical protein
MYTRFSPDAGVARNRQSDTIKCVASMPGARAKPMGSESLMPPSINR